MESPVPSMAVLGTTFDEAHCVELGLFPDQTRQSLFLKSCCGQTCAKGSQMLSTHPFTLAQAAALSTLRMTGKPTT